MTDPSDSHRKDKMPYSVWEFNYKPESYVHESWVSDLPNAELIQKLIQEDNGEQRSTRLSHHLMSQLGFNGKFYFDFSDSLTRVALLKSDDLQTLVMHLGLMFHFDDIRHTITKDLVVKYREELGKDLYQFALTIAPKFKKKQLKSIRLPKDMPIKEQVLVSGLICLFTAVKSNPVALLKRLLIKLPREWFDLYVHYSSKLKRIPGGQGGNANIVKLILSDLNIEVKSDGR
ncbi:MAG: SctK family type III secretion system sorting platform protein [Thiotrichaceae bacterium]|nr:SctK family type III secretion system sorting platform protein [Thiotrichaceae bacterium]